MPAIKDDVFEYGSVTSAAQFEKSNKAIIEYIRHKGSKEPILIAEALEMDERRPSRYPRRHRRSKTLQIPETWWMIKRAYSCGRARSSRCPSGA
jgi:hypothetical protein